MAADDTILNDDEYIRFYNTYVRLFIALKRLLIEGGFNVRDTNDKFIDNLYMHDDHGAQYDTIDWDGEISLALQQFFKI